ncbi:MAG: response regulator [Candidatus Hodarchaeales archaeon]
MNNIILVVEDNIQILKNIELILNFNDFHTVTALNGIEAIEILTNSEEIPDLIISDIMMPEMDGYSFFQSVSKNQKWGTIPFVFLTAKATPDDIRFGKLLGVDDYITKPFKEEDLLATIRGKLLRKKRMNQVNKKVAEMISSVKILHQAPIKQISSENICLIYAIWDEERGPIIKTFYPENWQITLSVEDLGAQLFQATVAIYGYENYDQSQGVLLDIKNISSSGFLFFDSIPDKSVRGDFRQFMICVLAPRMSYFDTLKINLEIKELSQLIKKSLGWEIREYWAKISNILIKN